MKPLEKSGGADVIALGCSCPDPILRLATEMRGNARWLDASSRTRRVLASTLRHAQIKESFTSASATLGPPGGSVLS